MLFSELLEAEEGGMEETKYTETAPADYQHLLSVYHDALETKLPSPC